MQDKHTDCEIVAQPISAIVKGGLRSIAASFPGFASLGQAWNEYETHRTSSRIQELLNNLKAELERMGLSVAEDSEAVRRCHVFPELLEIAIEKVRREYGESKRATYARVLARFLVGGNERGHEEKVALLESLDSLSERDLEVLLLFRGKEEAQIGDIRWRELGLPGDLSNQLWELTCHLAKLESRGLLLKVSQGTGVVYVRDGLTAAAARSQESRYRLLPLGVRLLDVLS